MDISYSSLGFIALICVVDSILILIFNGWIHYMKFHERFSVVETTLDKKEMEIMDDFSSSEEWFTINTYFY